MKVITYSLPISSEYYLPQYILNQCPLNQLLFFDIETTGFIAKNTTLYLIGALYYTEKEVHVIQWFNEDGKSEKELILGFMEFTSSFTHLIHFNGTGFDIPYLKQKSQQLAISYSLENSLTQIDIYKKIKPLKKIIQTDNLKQVTIEQYLGIQRKDTYTGGELIPIYQRFIATNDSEYEKLLLLHNHDDLLGMPKLSRILNYCSFFQNPDINDFTMEVPPLTDDASVIQYQEQNNNKQHLQIYFDIADNQTLDKRIIYQSNDIYLNIQDTRGYLSIPVLFDVLLHFFEDYKNYYYLPQEDMAIHKSVATYVDKSNRIKATKNNCYIKKQDFFIPCYQNISCWNLFSKNPNDKIQFTTINCFLSADKSLQKEYIKHVIQKMW
ncbi:MAG: ribonuclease H-like domain-containing protein [Lachnospiraceae bacterium]